jgi:hypothetical protein
MSAATTADAARNTSASSSGNTWLTGLVWTDVVRAAWVRAAVTGIAIVVVSLMRLNPAARLSREPRRRLDVVQTLRDHFILVILSHTCHSGLAPGRLTGYSLNVTGSDRWPSARTIRPRRRDETANRDHMNPRTGSDAAEPPSWPFGLNQGLSTAKMARNWGVTVSTGSDIV